MRVNRLNPVQKATYFLKKSKALQKSKNQKSKALQNQKNMSKIYF